MKKDRGWIAHAVVAGAGALWFLFGYIREVIQHDWNLTLHQWLEALAWPAGWFLISLLGLLIIALIKRRGSSRTDSPQPPPPSA